MDQYPRAIYKSGGPLEYQGGSYTVDMVNDEAEESTALSKGWALTPAEADKKMEASNAAAIAAALAAKAASDVKPPEFTAPATRGELEAMAKSLQIQFSPATTDAELKKLVDAKAPAGTK